MDALFERRREMELTYMESKQKRYSSSGGVYKRQRVALFASIPRLTRRAVCSHSALLPGKREKGRGEGGTGGGG